MGDCGAGLGRVAFFHYGATGGAEVDVEEVEFCVAG